MKFVVDLSKVALGDTADKLVRIPLAVMGKFVKGAQKFAITREDLLKLVENFRKRGTGEVVIDYEHASEFPEVAQGQPIPAAGWLKQVEDEPDASGILWGLAEFTERAREFIQKREYKYLSPAINWGAKDKGTGAAQGATLASVALVNRPFLEALPAIQLSEGWEQEVISQETSGADKLRHREERKEKGMGTTAVKFVEGNRVEVTCGECEKRSQAEVTLPAGPKVVRLSDVKRDKEGRFDFLFLAELEGGTLVANEVFHALTVQQELDAAVEAGKVLPAQRAHFEKVALADLAGFRELVKSLPNQVELGERGIAGGGGAGMDLKRVDARIDELTREKLKADKGLTYGAAFKLVLSEHPDLRDQKSRLMQER